MEVVVFGSAIVDFICYVDRLPKPGETLHGSKFSNGYGGKGANQACQANRLGAQTALIAKLGDDSFGTNYLKYLSNEGINIEFVKQCKGESTGIAQISVSADGENHIIIVTGANNLLGSDDVLQAQDLFKNAKILICQLETPIEATLTALRSFKGISILNAAPALANTPKDLLQTANIFCVNESEAALMIGSDEISSIEQSKNALRKLIEMGANTVIITLGALGAVYVSRTNITKQFHVPSQKVEKPLDTTGAGDAFIGALAFFILRYPSVELHQQIGAACEVASFSVQYAGTQSSFPNSTQIDINLNQKIYEWKEI